LLSGCADDDERGGTVPKAMGHVPPGKRGFHASATVDYWHELLISPGLSTAADIRADVGQVASTVVTPETAGMTAARGSGA
jgi:hypothetical protein